MSLREQFDKGLSMPTVNVKELQADNARLAAEVERLRKENVNLQQHIGILRKPILRQHHDHKSNHRLNGKFYIVDERDAHYYLNDSAQWQLGCHWFDYQEDAEAVLQKYNAALAPAAKEG